MTNYVIVPVCIIAEKNSKWWVNMIHFFNFVIYHNWCVCSFFFSFLGLNHGICENETSSNRGNAILSISKKYQKTEEGVQQRRPTESEGMLITCGQFPVTDFRFSIHISVALWIIRLSTFRPPPPSTRYVMRKPLAVFLTEKQLRRNVIEKNGSVLWRKLSRYNYFQAQNKNVKQTENFIRITRTSSAKWN